MRLMKVFASGELPPVMGHRLLAAGIIVPDGFGAYTCGAYVAEAVTASDPDSYPDEEVEAARATDAWFMEHRVAVGERILIEHGAP